MVESETILVGILVPIIIGPISVFFTTLWDKYSSNKLQLKQNYYKEIIKDTKEKLSLFYWPIYIKLVCLYHLNYNRSFENNKEGIEKKCEIDYSNEEFKLDTQEKETQLKEIVDLEGLKNYDLKEKKNNKKKKKKNKKQLNRYNRYGGNKYGVDRYDHDIYKNYKKKEHISIKITDEMEWDNYIKSNSSSHESDTSEGENSDFTGDGVGIVNSLPQKNICITGDILEELDIKLLKLRKDISNIIEKNIAIAQPKSRLGRELTKFIRFVEIEEVVFNNNLKNEEKTNSNLFGVPDNTKELLEIIEKDVFILQKKYNRLIKYRYY